MSMQYKNAIFDLDGTLINSLADLAAAVNAVLTNYGFPTFTTDEYRYKVGNGAQKLIERSLPQDKAADPAFVQTALAKFKTIYTAHAAYNTKPYDGIIDTLTELHTRGVTLGICTNKPQGAAEEIARTMLGKIPFAVVIGDGGGLPIKPDPAKVQLICRKLSISPADTIFVGDSAVDMETAVNSGCLPVGVLWGFREREELLSAGAKVLLTKPQELLRDFTI